jgi:hypothetical protein
MRGNRKYTLNYYQTVSIMNEHIFIHTKNKTLYFYMVIKEIIQSIFIQRNRCKESSKLPIPMVAMRQDNGMAYSGIYSEAQRN